MLNTLLYVVIWVLLGSNSYIGTFATQSDSSMVIKGTSTLHDWEMKTEKVDALAKILIESEKIKNLNDFTGTINVKSLKSGKLGMDGNAYNALKADDYPEISFTMKQVNEIDYTTHKISALFTVTIAGVTKEMIVDGVVTELEDNYLRIKGEKAMKMTDFKVDPPSFMFGTITTGDAITLVFDMVMSNNNQ